MSNYQYAAACLQQGMSYAGAARAANVNEIDLRRTIPRALARRLEAEGVDAPTPFEECAAILSDASAKDCRKTAALALALLCEHVGPVQAQTAMVNIACAMPAVRAVIPSPPPVTDDVPQGRVSAREVIAFVGDKFGLSASDMVSVRRPRNIARPRQIAMYAVHHLCPHMSYPAIAKLLNRGDHTTIIHGVRKVAELVATDPLLAEQVDSVIRHFESQADAFGGSPFAAAVRFRRLCDQYGAAMAGGVQ